MSTEANNYTIALRMLSIRDKQGHVAEPAETAGRYQRIPTLCPLGADAGAWREFLKRNLQFKG